MLVTLDSNIRKPLYVQIRDQLRDRILNGGLKPGDRLPQERDLIEQFGVSKGTIREALKALDAQGIIKTRTGPGGGAFIAPVNESGALELLGKKTGLRPRDL